MKTSKLAALAILALGTSIAGATTSDRRVAPAPEPISVPLKYDGPRPKTTKKNDSHRINKGSAVKTKNRAKAKVARIARKRK